jgi:membrane protein YdbS with pleckstrin-like domain
VIISTEDRADALVLRHIDDPKYWAEEIMEHAGQTRKETPAKTVQTLANESQTTQRSAYWLFGRAAPYYALLWVCASTWVVIRLSRGVPTDILLRAVEVLTLLSLVVLVPLYMSSFLHWWYRVYVVTERRVMLREGLLSINSKNLPLDQVNSVMVITVGVAQYIGVGDVHVSTASVTGDIRMRNIAGAEHVCRRIMEAKELLRRQTQQLEIREITSRLTATLRL